MSEQQVQRKQVQVDGTGLSYLEAGGGSARTLLLLHGTFWSRVWLPVLPALGTHSRCVALDLPGFGASDGELDVHNATVPELARTVLAAADALGMDRFDLAGHDIGGGIAQHVAATSGRVDRLVLMNSVMFDSWPVPAVERFRDPQVRASMRVKEMMAARAETTRKAVARPLSEEEVADYVSPLKDPVRVRSWMAMAAAVDARYRSCCQSGDPDAARAGYGRDAPRWHGRKPVIGAAPHRKARRLGPVRPGRQVLSWRSG